MLEKFIINENFTIKSGMQKINSNGKKLIFVSNYKGSIIGVLTDGDIRRAILKKINLKNKIGKIVNKKFRKIYSHEDREKGINLLFKNRNKELGAIPVLNNKGKLIDVITKEKLYNIPIFSPSFTKNELKNLTECITTKWISSAGKFVKDFEEKFSNLHKSKYALAVSSGTTALHLALLSIGINKNDEVLVPDITFAATINSVLYTGAKPVIVDIHKKKWTIDIKDLKKKITKKTKAIIGVHLFGNPFDIDALNKICKKNRIFLIEDCAEAIGSKYQKNRVGDFSICSTFSFYGNKTITTGEGGMLLTNNKKIYQQARSLRDHGMSITKRYYHEMVGYNYRLSNLQAAVGVAQINNLEKIVNLKRKIFKYYKLNLKKYKFIVFQENEDFSVNSYWAVGIYINLKDINIEKLALFLKNSGIEVRTFFYPLSSQKIYKKYFKYIGNNKKPTSVDIFSKSLMLPSYPDLNKKEIKYICDKIIQALKK